MFLGTGVYVFPSHFASPKIDRSVSSVEVVLLDLDPPPAAQPSRSSLSLKKANTRSKQR